MYTFLHTQSRETGDKALKQSILAAWTGLLITFGMSFLAAELDSRHAAKYPLPAVTAQPAAVTEGPEIQVIPPAAAAESLLVKQGDTLMEMALEDYILGVLAAEMPAEFEPEALKAQAVAARSYALYCAAADKHGDAQLCTDHRCCQAWKSDEAMRDSWGANYEKYRQKLLSAVESTKGEYLSYEGEPVFAAFHSSSAGYTESSGAIWNPLPYLVSVESPEDESRVPNFTSTLELSVLDFRDTLLHACPEADFSGEESGWIGQTSYEDSGRVESVLLGGVIYPGTKLRELFALRSTAFTLEYTGESFLFTVTGYGHGVGMSQYGAEVMAASGSDYAAILAHYYPGTVLVG